MRPISNYLDQSSLGNKCLIIWQKEFFSCRNKTQGCTPGRLLMKGVLFSGFRYESVGISLVEVYESQNEICHFGLYGVPKGLIDELCGCETFWFVVYSYFLNKCIHSS